MAMKTTEFRFTCEVCQTENAVGALDHGARTQTVFRCKQCETTYTVEISLRKGPPPPDEEVAGGIISEPHSGGA